jgi:hypothetical protein
VDNNKVMLKAAGAKSVVNEALANPNKDGALKALS